MRRPNLCRPLIRCLRALCAASVLATTTAGAAGDGPNAALLSANIDVSNIASLQRGARNFVNYCMGCHSAQYVRYNRLAQDLGLSEDQLIENLMFAADKPHDTMTIAMPADDAQRWFGQPPPDLTLVARSRGTDFLYSFLKAFYVDDSRAIGVNNAVLQNASMPHVLWELQGLQAAVFEDVVSVDRDGNESVKNVFKGFELIEPGTLSEDEYDQFVIDIVTFLDYIGEPMKLERQRLGYWVLTYLLVFGVLAYFLKAEIWKDIKK